MDRGSNEEECILLGIFGGFFSFSLESNETFFVVLQRFFFFFCEIPWAWKATRKARKREIFLGRFFLG